MEKTLDTTISILQSVLNDFITRRLPHRRLAKLAGLILLSNITIEENLISPIIDSLLSKKKEDGGWVDCEDTAWCAYVIRQLSNDKTTIKETINWILDERNGNAWGYCKRDTPCIPITAQIRLFLPELSSDVSSGEWIEKTWHNDLESFVKLSYKAAWYLLAHNKNELLMKRTVEHLISDQRNDGGWGPWRLHPAPTDCFSTGISMWALANSHVPNAVIQKSLCQAIQWCEQNRLSNGLFPTHYIEEGSAWILLGWSHALRYLNQISD